MAQNNSEQSLNKGTKKVVRRLNHPNENQHEYDYIIKTLISLFCVVFEFS